jgi:(1->4)-alpha-D-glucan 1-alpha-D-glucosylmutase
MSAPRATMRLQFHRGFTFDDALAIVPYIEQLGISHVYASPILKARPGSQHGYDVVDPHEVNPELGGEKAYRRLVTSLRASGLSIIVDIVPNHMAVVGAHNRWWFDVLKHGRQSRFARYFDIDWAPDTENLRDKVLVPILGRPLREALDNNEIELTTQDSGQTGEPVQVKYFDHILPLSRASIDEILARGLDRYLLHTSDGRKRLFTLLGQQHYRLASWRVANDEVNWRRFFDINELAALRVEDDDVFEAVHPKSFALFGEGLIDGFRIDHIDGLTDPAGYCRRLKARLLELASQRPGGARVESAYVVVEKILGRDETLPMTWQCDGTTGYDFMDQVSAVLHDPAGEVPLTRMWQQTSGRSDTFLPEEELARKEILDRSFSAQLEELIASLHCLSRDVLALDDMSRPSIRRAIIEILVAMRIYRSYDGDEASRARLVAAVAQAQRTCLRIDRSVVATIGEWLAANVRDAPAAHVDAIRRFRQLSAPLAANSVEDTAFYRYGPMLSRIDVGFDPGRFASEIAEFHRASLQRSKTHPASLLATATHDHKRGEDVRARLAVLSEIPQEWTSKLRGWMDASKALSSAPSVLPADIAILFQMIVGAWPPDLTIEEAGACQAYAERLSQWQIKALREAKLATDWTDPNENYEKAARDLLFTVFANPSLLGDIADFASRIAAPGAVNGLVQTVIKATSPGVPDFYQGTDFWDLSLVDPDNRRPVDFAARTAALADAHDIQALARNWRDGRIKQAVIARCLAARRNHARLFAGGEYIPLTPEGPAADHLIAYARRTERDFALIVAIRHSSRLLDGTDTIRVPTGTWTGTHLAIPRDIHAGGIHNVLTGTILQASSYGLDRVFDGLPIAVSISSSDGNRV